MEIWKDIPWYEWLYEASNYGRVKSMYRKEKFKHTFRIRKEKIIKEHINKHGYMQVLLCKNSKSKTFLAHRLILFAFRWELKLECNHKNGVKTDNSIENLEYCSKSENQLHKYKILGYRSPMLWKLWKLNHKSKEISQYDLEWKFIKIWYWAREIKRRLWFESSSITRVCNWQQKTSYWFYWKY